MFILVRQTICGAMLIRVGKLQFIGLIGGRILTEAAEKSHDVGRRYRCNICVSH